MADNELGLPWTYHRNKRGAKVFFYDCDGNAIIVILSSGTGMIEYIEEAVKEKFEREQMDLQESSLPDNYDKPSGQFCKCGKEMTIGELGCFGYCISCVDVEK